MTRLAPRWSLSLAVSGAAVAVVFCLCAPAVQAASTHRCSIAGKERRLGPTYVTRLSVRVTSCRRGEDVVRAYHRCRYRNGRRGRCSRTEGYRCTEHRFAVIRTQYDSHVTCRRGTARVLHTYTQYT